MSGYLSSLWPFKRDVPLPDDPPPPHPGAMSREQVLAHVEHLRPRLKQHFRYYKQDRFGYCGGEISTYITRILSDLEDVERLCTNENAQQFDGVLSRILPHLDELRTLTGRPCMLVDYAQADLGDAHKLWLDLCGLILVYDGETPSKPGTDYYWGALKKHTYTSEFTEALHLGRRDFAMHQLWPPFFGLFDYALCRCSVSCIQKPRCSWEYLLSLGPRRHPDAHSL